MLGSFGISHFLSNAVLTPNSHGEEEKPNKELRRKLCLARVVNEMFLVSAIYTGYKNIIMIMLGSFEIIMQK